MRPIPIGTKATASLLVGPQHLANMFKDTMLPPMFATPMMVLLAAGMLVLALSDLVLAAGPGLDGLFLGAALWGLHMALSQGLLSALVADTAQPALRGTGFGLFNLVTGIVLLLASVLAGALWQALGPAATFGAGGAFAAAATVALLVSGRPRLGR